MPHRWLSRLPDERFVASIHNFCRFTKWPDQGPDVPRRPLVIVAAGKPLPALVSLAKRTVRKRSIQIVILPADGQFPDACDVLLVNDLPPLKRNTLLAIAAERPVLTIARDPGFCQAGGIVEFFVVDSSQFAGNRSTGNEFVVLTEAD